METEVGELLTTLKEVQTSNKFILRRLNQLSDSDDTHCKCECHSKEESKDIKQLKTHVRHLEDADKSRNSAIEELRQQLNEVQDALRGLTNTGKDGTPPKLPTKPLHNLPPEGHLTLKHDTDSHNNKISEDGNPILKKSEDKILIAEEIDTSQGSSWITTEENNTSRASSDKDTKQDSERVRRNLDRGDVGHSRQTDGAQTKSAGTIGSGRQPPEPMMVYHVEESREAVNTQTRGQMAPVSQGSQTVEEKKVSDRSTKRQEHGTGHLLPKVIRQQQRVYKHQLAWELNFSSEMSEAHEEIHDLGGIHTVVCVDISESMAEDDAWTQASRFFMDFINGLIKMRAEGIDDEHVALVTFGHDTRVVTRLTNKYEDVRASFEQVCFVKGIKVDTKVVLITDGKPTPVDLVGGPDGVEHANKDEIVAGSLQIMEDIAKYNLEFFCVPVGKPDMEFLDLAVAIPKGKCIHYTEGEKFSRRTLLTLKAGSATTGVLGMLGAGLDPDIQKLTENIPDLAFGSLAHAHFAHDLSQLSEEDLEQIKEIMERGHTSLGAEFRKFGGDDGKYQESDSDILPTIGTRVRRGPDWSWANQDNGGAGTVIGHVVERKHIWVEWDADGKTYFYHYGGAGRYDVLPVDEPRRPADDGKLTVGCSVKPGPDWKDTRVQQFERGVVIRLVPKDDANVTVRWNNGSRGDYAHKYKGKSEVEFSPSFDDFGTGQFQTRQADVPKRKNKNKNKNAKS